MELITVREMSETLAVGINGVKRRIYKRGIKPVKYIGTAALYAPEVLEQIREEQPAHRPAKAKESAPATVTEQGDV